MVKSIEESKKIAIEHLNRLIDLAGSQAQLARMLSSMGGYSITPQGVKQWVDASQISKKGAIQVVKHEAFCSHFTLMQLRPDVPSTGWVIALNAAADEDEG